MKNVESKAESNDNQMEREAETTRHRCKSDHAEVSYLYLIKHILSNKSPEIDVHGPMKMMFSDNFIGIRLNGTNQKLFRNKFEPIANEKRR